MIVRRAFPILDEYDLDRIEFDASFALENTRWSRILDEAWLGFASNPPTRLRVRLADGPGDEAASEFAFDFFAITRSRSKSDTDRSTL